MDLAEEETPLFD